jgi:hypothetical protein
MIQYIEHEIFAPTSYDHIKVPDIRAIVLASILGETRDVSIT